MDSKSFPKDKNGHSMLELIQNGDFKLEKCETVVKQKLPTNEEIQNSRKLLETEGQEIDPETFPKDGKGHSMLELIRNGDVKLRKCKTIDQQRLPTADEIIDSRKLLETEGQEIDPETFPKDGKGHSMLELIRNGDVKLKKCKTIDKQRLPTDEEIQNSRKLLETEGQEIDPETFPKDGKGHSMLELIRNGNIELKKCKTIDKQRLPTDEEIQNSRKLLEIEGQEIDPETFPKDGKGHSMLELIRNGDVKLKKCKTIDQQRLPTADEIIDSRKLLETEGQEIDPETFPKDGKGHSMLELIRNGNIELKKCETIDKQRLPTVEEIKKEKELIKFKESEDEKNAKEAKEAKEAEIQKSQEHNKLEAQQTCICKSCSKTVEINNCIYYSGYPYHKECVKCAECKKTLNLDEEINNFVNITPGVFLCIDHYNQYLNSNHLNQEMINEYHEKKKQNFVDEVFNHPIFQYEKINNCPQDELLITPEIMNDSVQKKPYEDFIPTIALHFNKSPHEIDYDELQNILGDDVVILNVERGSTIIKIALLSACEFDSSISEKCKNYVSDLKGKLNTSIGKAVVGNLVEEPILNIPSDEQFNSAYNRTSINHLQIEKNLNKVEINEIKKKILQNLQNDKSNFNWKFIFSHEDLYDKLEKQAREDIKNNPYEMIIVGQTIIANKFFNEYEKIKSQIPKEELAEHFLYHGSALANHQKIVNKHFLMPGQDKMKQLDSGYYGKGIYATENMFYALMYANGYSVLQINKVAHVICCRAIYNKSKIKNLEDLSYYGKPIDSDIKNNYGINHAFVGDSKQFHPINFIEKSNCKIYAHEFVFPNKYQFVPCCSFAVMRKDHYILWKDESIENNENSGYLNELSKSLEVNIYSTNNNEDAFQIIRTKKHVMVKLITNGSKGKDFIEQARSLIGSHCVCLVFTSSSKHMEWVSQMENVLLTTNSGDFKKFAALKMNKNDILSFANELKKKYETSSYKFKINESELLNFPDRTFCYLNECNVA